MAFLKGLNLDAFKQALESGTKAAQEKISDLKVEDVIQGTKEAAASGKAAVEKAISGLSRDEEIGQEATSYKELIGLLWCLAYADGVISEEEREMLHSISGQLDEGYADYADDLESELVLHIQENARVSEQRYAAKVEAQRIIESVELSSNDAKLLCWNLLALANSDGLDDAELDLIAFVAEKSKVEASVFEELKNYSDAIVEIEVECNQLKSSNRGFSEIAPLVEELSKREQVVLEAAQALIADR